MIWVYVSLLAYRARVELFGVDCGAKLKAGQLSTIIPTTLSKVAHHIQISLSCDLFVDIMFATFRFFLDRRFHPSLNSLPMTLFGC